jgi:hypothetical protein
VAQILPSDKCVVPVIPDCRKEMIMRLVYKWLVVLFVAGITSASANAACGGGGYTPSKSSKPSSHVSYTSNTGSSDQHREVAEKMDKLQNELDKAQMKLRNCSGECNKERRKVNEANEKLAAHINRYGIIRASTSSPATIPTSTTTTTSVSR